MIADKKIICVMLARDGSKRLPGKNIKLLNGRPLIGYAITAAKGSRYVDRVIVSTDDEEIARVAREQGAETPFLRPAELASDTATVIAALQHAVAFVQKEEESVGLIVLIQPTTPGILTEDIDTAIEKVVRTKASSCVPLCEIAERPEWMFSLEAGERITPFIKPYTGVLSTGMPKLYRLNGSVFVTTPDMIMKENKIFDPDTATYILMPTERSTDIDTATEFAVAEALMATNK